VVDTAVVVPAGPAGTTTDPQSNGPFRVAWRRFRRNRNAMIFLGVLVVIVVMCLLAPVYAHHVAHTGPNSEHISEVVSVHGRPTDVLSTIGVPIGPTWHSRFFLGADLNGRDVAVRALYGGRTSLLIGLLATIITMVGALVLGVAAGFFGGWVDSAISRLLEVIWAYPALLLGVALGVSLAVGGLTVGPIHIHSGSILLPALVIGVVYIPYVARPLRGEVLTLREREFVDAARILGYGRFRVIVSEVIPNLTTMLIVFFALQLAQSIVLEASLSFLGAGVQAPNASWGTMLASGVGLVTASPHLTVVPGALLVLTVLSVNIVGDGLRDAFDPRAKIPSRRKRRVMKAEVD
jgi:peptide/nickel transport system permease protein